jgi:hypothetical protein
MSADAKYMGACVVGGGLYSSVTPFPYVSVSGNMDVSGSVTATGNLNIANGASTGTISMNGAVLTTGNVVSLTNSATSTTTATGALQVTGGVGIGGNLNVGGNVNVSNQIQFSYSTLPTLSTTSIGYTGIANLATLAAGIGVRNSSTISVALPIGVYMCTLWYQIDITNGTTNRCIIEFAASTGANLISTAKTGFVYLANRQEYNYYSFPAIVKVTANPSTYYSILIADGGNASLSFGQMAWVRVA